jgi:cell division initiation protein
MMTPSQLKEYEFKTAGRNAYKADEVDDFFAEVAANYTKMFHENGELVRRVGLLADRLEKYKKEEDEIKSAVVSAQRAADIIVRDAKNSVADAESEAKAILDAAKSEAELIKSDAEKQAVADSELLLSMTRDKAQEIIRRAKEEAQSILLEANSNAKNAMGAATRTMTSESLHYEMLKKEVSQFKSEILSQYKTHIELISKLPDLAEEEAKKMEPAEKEEPQPQELPAVEEAKVYSQEDVKEEVAEIKAEFYAAKEEYAEAEPEYFEDKTEAEGELKVWGVNTDLDASLDDLMEDQIQISVDDSTAFSATDFAESNDSLFSMAEEESQQSETIEYFASGKTSELLTVDDEMLTDDGELVVKTDLPLSFFDDTDNLEFIDDFEGMEKDPDVGSFSFSSVQTNNAAIKRPSNRVTVDSAYLDFLAAESEAENVGVNEPDDEDDEDDADDNGVTIRKGFFKRR